MKQKNIVLQTITKIVAPVIILFSISIFFGGHYSPGGGFVGGLLTSSAILLLLMAFDMKTVEAMIPIDYKLLVGVGLLISAFTVAGPIFFGLPLLTHSYEHVNLPLLGDTSLHTAVLFDLGVYLVVVGVTMTIIQTIGERE